MRKLCLLLLVVCSSLIYGETIVDVKTYFNGAEAVPEAFSFGLKASMDHQTKAPAPPMGATTPRLYLLRENWPVQGIDSSLIKDYQVETLTAVSWKLVVEVPAGFQQTVTLGFDASAFKALGKLLISGGSYTDYDIAKNLTSTADRLTVTGGVYTISYDKNLTPAIGLKMKKKGDLLSWTVEEEIGVKAYQIVDRITGEVVDTVVAGDLGAYSYRLESETDDVVLKVVDRSGFKQNYLLPKAEQVRLHYAMAPGWNLIAMPGKNADVSELHSLSDCRFWTWNGQAYEEVIDPVAGQGIWFFSERAANVVISAEVSKETLLPLSTGWNLVGPTVNMVVPEDADAIFTWNKIYQQIAEHGNGLLIQGVGYWIFSESGN